MRERRIDAGCVALVVLETLGVLLLFAPIPVAWMWLGGFVYRASGSLFGDLVFALAGFLGSACAMFWALARVDQRWIGRRRRLGRDQGDGALTRVVITTIGIALPIAYVWFNVSGAVVIKFMPH